MSHNKTIGFPPQDLSQLTYQSDSGTSFMIVTESHLSNAVAAEYLNFSGLFPRESSISQGYELQVSSSEHEKLENSQNSLSIEYMFRAGSQGYSQETMLPTVSCSAIDDRPLTFTGLFQRVCSEEHATEEYQTSLLNDNQPKSTSRMKRKPLADDNGRSDLKKPIKRPGLSYSKMIMDVLLEGGRMTVQEIVKCIQDKYPNNFNKEEKRWKACIRNCLTQKDHFIRETSKRKGNYWKLSDDLLQKLRPHDNSSQSEFLETSSVDRSTWNTGRYVTIAPKQAYYSDSSLDGVVKQGEFYPADISNDNYSTPLKSSVLANNRQCFSEERNSFNAEGEINRILDYSKSCHSLEGVLVQGGSYITDTSNGSCNTPLKLSTVGNSRHCFSEDRNLLRSNSNVIGGRVKIIDYSKSCSQPNQKRGSEVFHDENGTPISRKRSRFAKHTLPKVKTMQGFRGRLDMDKKLAQPEERLANNDVPYQFLSVSKAEESSSNESRGFNISSVSSERFDAKNRNQFARGSHQFKDLTNVLQNTSSTKKGRRYESVTRNSEKIKTENRKSFLFKRIGEDQSFGSPIRSNGHSEGRLFSTDLLNSVDMLNRRKGSGETSTLVRSISLPNSKRNSVKDLNEISGGTGEATTRNAMTEITPAETSTAVRSISLDYDDRNSGEYLNECSGAATDVAVGEVTTAETSTAAVRSISLDYDDRNSEEYSNECSGAATDAAVGEITTAETLDAEISTSLYSDDIIFGEGLNEFPDDELRETTGEIATVESPNSDDIGRDEVFAALANETFSPPELGDTWDNFDLSVLDNL